MTMLLKATRLFTFILIMFDGIGPLMGVTIGLSGKSTSQLQSGASDTLEGPLCESVFHLLLKKMEDEQTQLKEEITKLKQESKATNVLMEQTTPLTAPLEQGATDRILEAVLQLQEDMKQVKLKLSLQANPVVSGEMFTEDLMEERQDGIRFIPDRPRDCFDILQQGKNESGIYTIYPQKCGIHTNDRCGLLDEGVRVQCDMNQGDEWTVILLRRPVEGGQVDFNQNWRGYRIGFGDPETEYWMGNDALHLLTSGRSHILRVDMTDWDGETRYAEYNHFFVDDRDNEYSLNVGRYSGTAGDSLKYHDGMLFSTSDRDNDKSGSNCAYTNKSGFWYNSCATVTPTNPLLPKQKSANGITWVGFHSDRTTLKEISFKVKPSICRRE